MSISDRMGDTLYSVDGEPMVTACRGGDWPAMPPCAYCEEESTRTCDAPAGRLRAPAHRERPDRSNVNARIGAT